jgi:hypothetical protein
VIDTLIAGTNVTLGAAIDAAIDGNPTLTAAAALVSNAAGVVTIAWVAGQGLIDVTLDYAEATQTPITFGGTLVDGPYQTTISGGGLGAPVVVTTTRTAAVPATATAMAIQHEADIEALVGTTLAGVVQSADDNGAGRNTLIMNPGIAAVTVTTLPPRQTFDLTVAGTPTDGVYSGRINHASLPGGSQPYTFTRGAGETNTQIADALEVDIEGNGAMLALVESADNTGAVCAVLSLEGASGITLTDEAAPAPGTLASNETSPEMTVGTAIVPPVTVTAAHFLAIDLNIVAKAAFPTNVIRGIAAVDSVVGFGAGRNFYVGRQGGDVDAILPVLNANTTGRIVAPTTVAEYQPRHENAFVPQLTLELGDSVALPTGDFEIQIGFSPSPGPSI